MRRRRTYRSGGFPRNGLPRARGDLPVVAVTPPVSSYVSAPILGDLRVFHPAGRSRPAVSFYRASAKLIAGQSTDSRLSARVGFAVPKDVGVCVRRKQRKEVIHALGKAGRSGRKRRRYRRTVWSSVDC